MTADLDHSLLKASGSLLLPTARPRWSKKQSTNLSGICTYIYLYHVRDYRGTSRNSYLILIFSAASSSRYGEPPHLLKL